MARAGGGGETALSNPSTSWESSKTATIRFAKAARLADSEHEKSLWDRYCVVKEETDADTNADLEEHKSLEKELKELHKVNRAIERSHSNWALHKERPFK